MAGLGFVFKNPADSASILGGFWPIDEGSLMLKRWRLGFNPATEFFGLRHLWVLLPGLPLHLWNPQALERIGAAIGRFLKLDSNLLETEDRRLAKIYVEVDIQAGLPEVLEIEWRGRHIAQNLDFLGIPFRCSFCRRTGHLRRDCSKFPPTEEIFGPCRRGEFQWLPLFS
jgi:hypothetical protein